MADRVPPHAWFLVSAVFHYLGPAFAVLLFARVDVLGVAWLRVAAAALVFAVWRRPLRTLRRADGPTRRLLAAWGAVLAVMNACFYLAIDRLPLATVAATEFLPVVALAALGARTARNAAALVLAAGGVYALTGVRLEGDPLGVAFAAANAALFAAYIVLAHRASRGAREGGAAAGDGDGRAAGGAGDGDGRATGAVSGIDGLAAAMVVAAVVVTPIGGWEVVGVLDDPVALAAGVGVGVCSSVVPYVADQLAMRALPRATYALLVALLPATATVIGIVVLTQVPSPCEAAGVALVIGGVALHRAHDYGDSDAQVDPERPLHPACNGGEPGEPAVRPRPAPPRARV